MFLSRIAWWSNFFFHANYCQGLKSICYGGIRTWLEHINAQSDIGGLIQWLPKSLSGIELVSPKRLHKAAISIYIYSFSFQSQRIYILLVLNFALRMVNSLRPGSTPLPLLPLALKMVSGIGQRPEWSKTWVGPFHLDVKQLVVLHQGKAELTALRWFTMARL